MADSAKLQRMDGGVHEALQRIGRRADLIVLGIVALGWVVALWIGLIHGRPGTAAAWGALLTGAGALAYWLAPGTLLSRLVIVFSGMAMVALHLQLSLGQPEFHFGVFVFLAFLLAYRDWRPVLFAALVIAVHHVAFDRLQLAGLPLYCLSEPDFARILVHAAFVVVQATVEVLIALRMRGDAIESAELQQLSRRRHRVGRAAAAVPAPGRRPALAGCAPHVRHQPHGNRAARCPAAPEQRRGRRAPGGREHVPCLGRHRLGQP